MSCSECISANLNISGVLKKLQQKESRDHSNNSTPSMTPESESNPGIKGEVMSPKLNQVIYFTFYMCI